MPNFKLQSQETFETFVVGTPINNILQDLETCFSAENIGLQRVQIVTDIEDKDANSSFYAAVVTDYAYSVYLTIDMKYIAEDHSSVDLVVGSTGANFIWLFSFLFLLIWLYVQWLPILLLAVILLVMASVVAFRRVRIRNHLYQALHSILGK